MEFGDGGAHRAEYAENLPAPGGAGGLHRFMEGGHAIAAGRHMRRVFRSGH